MKFTSIYTIFLRLKRDYNLTELNQSDVIEWSADALEAIGAVQIMEKKLKLLHVKNHLAQLPNGLIDILQVNRVYGYEGKCLCDQFNTMFIAVKTKKPKIKQVEDCTKQQFCTDFIYLKPDDTGGLELKPIRKAESPFFVMNACEECENAKDKDGDYDYFLYAQRVNDIVFSFKEGIVALTYFTIPTDEQGFPLIPDVYQITDAVSKYIAYKYFTKQFYIRGDKTDFYKMNNAKQEWLDAVKRAANYAMMPDIDDLQNMYEVLTNPFITSRYYNSFKTIQSPQLKPLNRR